MKTVRVTFKDGETESHLISGTFLYCHKVLYATYGRLNIKRIQFYVLASWRDSPYFVNPLEAYNVQ